MKSESPSEQYEILRVRDKEGRVTNYWKPMSEDGLKKYNTKKEWQQRVYKKKEHILSEQANLIEFNILAKAIFKRDRSSCKSCFKTRRKLLIEDSFLTVHHILPREEGGQNEVDNLVTLCNACHDKIEELKLRSMSEIYGYFSGTHKHWHRKENEGIKWQQWVYGGYHKP